MLRTRQENEELYDLLEECRKDLADMRKRLIKRDKK